jgi:hypothetical protein
MWKYGSYRLLGRVISPAQGRYLHRTTQTQEKTRADAQASSGIRTHDPNDGAAEDICLRPRGHCDRLIPTLLPQLILFLDHQICY